MRVDSVRARVFALVVVMSLLSTVASLVGGPITRSSVLLAVSLLVTVTTIIRISRTTGFARGIFAILLGGFLLLNAAVTTWLVTFIRGLDEAATYDVWQTLLGSSYLFLLAAAGLVVARSARQDPGGMLDSATLAVAAASVLWQAIVAPALESSGAPMSQRAYVFMVLIALSGSIGVVIGLQLNGSVSETTRPVMLYFIVALGITIAANTLSAIFANPQSLVAPWWVGVLWPLAFASAWGAIADPESANAFLTRKPRPSRLTSMRIGMLGVAMLLTPLVAVLRNLAGGYVGWVSSASVAIVLIVLVMLRVGQLAAAHRDAESRLTALADQDVLTGIANRRAADRHLDALAARVATGDSPGAITCFIDLDGFKAINDTRGHAAGDELLTAVAGRLAHLARADTHDLVARLGGDEFLLLIEGDPTTADTLATRIDDALTAPFRLTDGPATIRASIGTASTTPAHPLTADELLTHADHAMYEVKRESREQDGV